MGEVRDASVTRDATSDLERLYRDHGGRLWRAIVAFTASREVADDAVAEAFAQLLRRGQAVRDPLAWVWRAAFRIAAGELADRRQRGLLLREQVYEMPLPAIDVFAALAKLSPMQRAAVLLHHYADRPVAEIAETLGTTRAAVRVHLSRGRRRLRGELASSHE